MTLGSLALRFQTATRWTPSTSYSTSGFGGPQTWTRSLITVRWEDRVELYTDRQGSEHRSNATVYSGVDLKEGDFLYLGTSTQSDPLQASHVYEVRDFRKIPDLHNKFYERRALMSMASGF